MDKWKSTTFSTQRVYKNTFKISTVASIFLAAIIACSFIPYLD